jgi:hypothetical protein
VLLKGVGFSRVWQDTAVLCGYAVVLILLSVKRFTKTIG